jgi:hypothetical protein
MIDSTEIHMSKRFRGRSRVGGQAIVAGKPGNARCLTVDEAPSGRLTHAYGGKSTTRAALSGDNGCAILLKD